MFHSHGSGNRDSDPFVMIELISRTRLTRFIVGSGAAELPAGHRIVAEDPRAHQIGHTLYNIRFAVVRQFVERSIADRLRSSQILPKCPRMKSGQPSEADRLRRIWEYGYYVGSASRHHDQNRIQFQSWQGNRCSAISPHDV